MEVITFPKLQRNILTTLQVNVGYRCNQSCSHCHVDAGPDRLEMMNHENISLIPKILELYDLSILDLTGGAPELHPGFKELVIKARELDVEVIDRCNLTILNEPGHEDLSQFLAKNKVTVIASLPCYEKANVDKQRGKGVFERSILGLRQLNNLGYGKKNNDLILNLVFNPQGADLPPPQIKLEEDYRKALYEEYGIYFNKLYTIANMPIKRFAKQLKISGELIEYQRLLEENFNPLNIENVMCKTLISVDWQGLLYDCDFNQQLGITVTGKAKHMKDLLGKKENLNNQSIQIGQHCFGCTAGDGSSCSGALRK